VPGTAHAAALVRDEAPALVAAAIETRPDLAALGQVEHDPAVIDEMDSG
jgi:hypothetical protein